MQDARWTACDPLKRHISLKYYYMLFSEDKRILEKIYKAWGQRSRCSPFPIEIEWPKWRGQQKFAWIWTERKQGKLFAHSRECCYQEDLSITDQGQDFHTELIGLLASLEARWAELLLGRCEKPRSTPETHAGPGNLNQHPESDLQYLLSDWTPGDKWRNFWCGQMWMKWMLLNLFSALLGIPTRCLFFVPRQAHRAQRMEMPPASFKISGCAELTKAGGETSGVVLGRQQGWRTPAVPKCYFGTGESSTASS